MKSNTIHKNLNIICTDHTKSYEICQCFDYDEIGDVIKIKTEVKNNELQRGWIGDLSYSTKKSLDMITGCDTGCVAKNVYKDVLLINVNIFAVNDGFITWEYVFSKK